MTAPLTITIDKKTYEFAANAGKLRQKENRALGRVHRWGLEGNGEAEDEQGAVGEYIAGLATGIFWPGPGTVKGADIGRNLQVRTGKSYTDRLILHPDDADEAVFISVVGEFPTYQVMGWCYGREGKRKPYWWTPPVKNGRKPRPAYFVPNEILRPIGDLRLSRRVKCPGDDCDEVIELKEVGWCPRHQMKVRFE